MLCSESKSTIKFFFHILQKKGFRFRTELFIYKAASLAESFKASFSITHVGSSNPHVFKRMQNW